MRNVAERQQELGFELLIGSQNFGAFVGMWKKLRDVTQLTHTPLHPVLSGDNLLLCITSLKNVFEISQILEDT